MMNIKEPLGEYGWKPECDDNGKPLTHRICGEWCHWYAGTIDGQQWSAWIGTDSGSVYLHSGGDIAFDEFVDVIKNGWPKVKPVVAPRGFDFGDNE